MPDLDLIKALTPLGVGGLLATMIFVFYRIDFLRERQNHVAERERQSREEARLLDMIERNATAAERLAVTIENLAKSELRRAAPSARCRCWAGLCQSTIRSARSSTDGGIVRPRALAVLRLMTSSNFVGSSTGRSAGFAPLRIRST